LIYSNTVKNTITKTTHNFVKQAHNSLIFLTLYIFIYLFIQSFIERRLQVDQRPFTCLRR